MERQQAQRRIERIDVFSRRVATSEIYYAQLVGRGKDGAMENQNQVSHRHGSDSLFFSQKDEEGCLKPNRTTIVLIKPDNDKN